MKTNNIFIALAGNIGVGKTTAGNLMQAELGYTFFEEPVKNNRFLTPYYTDMKRWAYTLQMEFLHKRTKYINNINATGKNAATERIPREDREIFAVLLQQMGCLTDDEFSLYNDHYEYYNKNTRQPDLIIYLENHNEKMLLERILHVRRREEEKGITTAFLRQLNKLYSKYPAICKEKYGTHVETINMEQYDIKNKEQQKQFISKLKNIIRA
jgi:deoxyadenosine/deoxycytidine kinase